LSLNIYPGKSVAESFKTESSFQPPNGRDVTTSLTDKETQKLLLERNHGVRNHTRDKCIHELFEAQAERTPEAVALIFEDQHLTYRELNERANQLAHHLQKLGVGPETLVGLFLERSLEMVVGLVAILKAGGAYVPMDPKYPRERLTFMLKDAHSPVVVTQKLLEGDLSDGNAKVICLDSDWLEISCEPTTNPVSDTQPHHLAYVIYTSGSTGTPKGSLISHCNVVRLFQETQVWFNFTQSDVWTLFHSCAFDFSVWELWGALFNGGRLVIVPFSVSRTPEDFHRLLCEEGVTVLNQTPSAFRQLIQVDEVKGPSPSLALRLIIFGGEALDFKSLKPWFERHGDQKPRLVNMYGITETTVHVTYRPIDAADLFGGSMIGIPIPDLQVYLLDEQGHSVPFGVPGEICVGGAGVGRGYLNRPELTAEKFIADPFSSKPGARLYKTGDLARYLPDGNLEFLGRIDQQVKIRGFRIELGEIEAVLNGHPAVRESVVIAREDVPGEKILAAYLVVRQEPAPTATELREFLLKKLPDYMVPAAFVKLEKLPLTPNGKIDRKALPVPDENRLGLGVQFVAPRTPTEVALAKIWCELLGVNQIGIHENYFELGGHSLMAVRIIFRIRDALKVELPVRMISEFPTISELSQVVDETGLTIEADSSPRPARMSTSESSSTAKFSASFGQEQLWFIDLLEPGSSVYNVPLAIRLRGQLDQAVLLKSINHLIHRHEVLRTTFQAENGVPLQMVAPELTIKLAVVNLENLPEAARGTEAERFMLEAANRPFDLSRGPLVQAELFGLGEENHILLLTIHHIVFDGWSVNVMLRDLAACYTAFCNGRIPELPDLPFQYKDFAAWQRKCLTAEIVEQHLDYWRKELAGVPTILKLPTDRPRETAQKNRGSQQYFKLSSKRQLHFVNWGSKMRVRFS
jgi:amino acid adenylation domain-containing protein